MRSAIQQLKDRRNDAQHAGLLLQRYLCEPVIGDQAQPEERLALLQAAIRAAQNQSVHPLYRNAFERWKNTFASRDDTRIQPVQTIGRLIVGLGSENVLETGITLHHTYGLPILPGSCLKGLAAHYCHRVWGQHEPRFRKLFEAEDAVDQDLLDGHGAPTAENYHRFLFGTTDDTGSIIFHDAWYIPGSDPEPLRLDVMTPHHHNWLQGQEPPTDFDSPIPVPFLSVSGQFLLVISWQGPDSNNKQNWLDLIVSLLCDALQYWGVGGKTSSGYGRLVRLSSVSTPASSASTSHSTAASSRTLSGTASSRKAGDQVQAVLLEEKTKKGGWKARLQDDPRSGPIQNSQDVPPDKKPGEVVTLIIASINDREVAFQWPPASSSTKR